MRVLLEGVEMTVSIAAKNFREKVRKSIMPLSVVLLVLSTVITVLLAAIVMMPDLTGNEMKSSSGILKCAALAIFAVFLIVMGFYIYNVVIPMITIEKKLFAAQDDGGRERLRKKNESTFVRKPFFNVYTELMSLIDDNATKADREYSLAMLKKQAEIKALQNQINPHFLYNTLDTMSGIANAQNCPMVSGMCHSLSAIFRYSLNMTDELSTVQNEMAHVRNYLYVMDVRNGSTIAYDYQIDSDTLADQMPRICIQPVVENALTHGLRNVRRKDKKLLIRSEHVNENLVITVQDNGAGMDAESMNRLLDQNDMKRVESGISIGILNVNARLKRLFGEKYGLHIESTAGEGTTVTITVPAVSTENSGDMENV